MIDFFEKYTIFKKNSTPTTIGKQKKQPIAVSLSGDLNLSAWKAPAQHAQTGLGIANDCFWCLEPSGLLS